MKRHIPNIITCLNALCGAISIITASLFYNVHLAAVFILIGMVFDFFDGMTARLLDVKSEIGKELDSLADMCTFGVAPAVLAFMLIDQMPGNLSWLAFSALLIPPFSAYRLAKFNLDSRQTVNFIGLPTPANALFWVGLIFGMESAGNVYRAVFDYPAVLALFAVLLSVALVSELPMFSLKLKGFSWKGNEIRYIYLSIALVLLVIMGKAMVMFLIPLYLLVCISAYYISARKSR